MLRCGLQVRVGYSHGLLSLAACCAAARPDGGGRWRATTSDDNSCCFGAFLCSDRNLQAGREQGRALVRREAVPLEALKPGCTEGFKPRKVLNAFAKAAGKARQGLQAGEGRAGATQTWARVQTPAAPLVAAVQAPTMLQRRHSRAPGWKRKPVVLRRPPHSAGVSGCLRGSGIYQKLGAREPHLGALGKGGSGSALTWWLHQAAYGPLRAGQNADVRAATGRRTTSQLGDCPGLREMHFLAAPPTDLRSTIGEANGGMWTVSKAAMGRCAEPQHPATAPVVPPCSSVGDRRVGSPLHLSLASSSHLGFGETLVVFMCCDCARPSLSSSSTCPCAPAAEHMQIWMPPGGSRLA